MLYRMSLDLETLEHTPASSKAFTSGRVWSTFWNVQLTDINDCKQSVVLFCFYFRPVSTRYVCVSVCVQMFVHLRTAADALFRTLSWPAACYPSLVEYKYSNFDSSQRVL